EWARRGDERGYLAIVAINREGHGDDLATPTRDQEDVGAPALIRGRLVELPEVRPAVATVDARRQHQPVELHHAPNAFAIVARPECPVDYRPHAAIAIRRPTVGHRADLLQHGVVRRAMLPAARTGPRDVVGGPSRDREDGTDHRHSVAGHRPDALRKDGVFFTTSCAARRISFSMVLRPR